MNQNNKKEKTKENKKANCQIGGNYYQMQVVPQQILDIRMI